MLRRMAGSKVVGQSSRKAGSVMRAFGSSIKPAIHSEVAKLYHNPEVVGSHQVKPEQSGGSSRKSASIQDGDNVKWHDPAN